MLDAILDDAERRADRARRRGDALRLAAEATPPARPFAAALTAPAVVAEIKRRSPSRGALAPGLDAAAQAKRYASGGAAALSVLTDPDHFDGSLDDLTAAAGATELPVLRKDFLLDPAQVWESRAAGADAVLLIVAALGREGLLPMLEAVGSAGIDALVEVHDEDEAAAALDAGATVIGVNNRDLTTFDVDLGVAERLASMLADAGAITVAESGVSEPAEATRMWELGYDAILVGEALITAPDPEQLLRRLVGP